MERRRRLSKAQSLPQVAGERTIPRGRNRKTRTKAQFYSVNLKIHYGGLKSTPANEKKLRA